MGVILSVQVIGILPFVTDQSGSTSHSINGQSLPLEFLHTLPQLMMIFLIIYLCDIIVDEYRSGTFKLVLLRPVSRLAVLHSKIISLLLAILFVTGFAVLSAYILGTVALGWGDYTILDNTTYTTTDGILLTLQAFMFSMLPQLGFGLLVMLIALLSTNTGITAGISLGLMVLYPFIEGVKLTKEYFIIHQMYNFHLYAIENITSSATSTGFLSCLIYIVLFYLGSALIIKRKNIYL
jgi:ABC-type transport system involved in multi-copper enzyme maturation permease subunit